MAGPTGTSEDVAGDLPVGRGVVVPAAELAWRFSRSGGPGGQSVNTSDSRVELSYDVGASTALGPVARARALERLAGRLVDGVVTVTAAEQRSQWQNRRLARARLAALLRQALAPPPRQRRATRPTNASVERRLASKRRRAETKRSRRAVED
jgi:ribosome-associated protein